MIALDWTALAQGAAAGTLMSVIFFAGLAFGMKRALQGRNTITILVLSAAVRIAAFLGVGWVVVSQAGPWAFAGYGIAFFICRRIATACAGKAVLSGGAR